MAKKTLSATQLQRIDSLENWVSKNPVLAQGEIGICTTSGQTFFKIGDGKTAWNSLSMTSGLAGDVYSWAKASTKPSYSYSEISETPGVATTTANGLMASTDKKKLDELTFTEFTEDEVASMWASEVVQLAEEVAL